MADEQTDTPPVAGEITDAAVLAAARAQCGEWFDDLDGDNLAKVLADVRAVLTAALPHLTADLRSYLASSARTVDDLRGVITTKNEEIDRLREGIKQIAWGLSLAATDFNKEFGPGPSDTRDVLSRVLDLATSLATPTDPAPSTEHLDVDQLPADRVEKLAQWLHGRNIGICEMDDDTVYNGIESMRELAQALLQHGPDGIRVTAPSTPEGDVPHTCPPMSPAAPSTQEGQT